MKRVLKRHEVVERLKAGDYILWLGGGQSSACMGSDFGLVVRIDTLFKLRQDGLITHFGYPELSGKVYWKQATKSKYRG